MKSMISKVRGKKVEIDTPNQYELHYIFESLQTNQTKSPLGIDRSPSIEHINKRILYFRKRERVNAEPVRFFIIRSKKTAKPIGFFVDRCWSYPTDSTREVNMVIPDQTDRNMSHYFDSTMAFTQYLYRNKLAKRIRWRTHTPKSEPPKRNARLGGRLIESHRHVDANSQNVTYSHIYEGTRSEFMAMLNRLGLNIDTDYGDSTLSVWSMGHKLKPTE